MGSNPRLEIWGFSPHFAHITEIQMATNKRSHICDRIPSLGDLHYWIQRFLGQIQ